MPCELGGCAIIVSTRSPAEEINLSPASARRSGRKSPFFFCFPTSKCVRKELSEPEIGLKEETIKMFIISWFETMLHRRKMNGEGVTAEQLEKLKATLMQVLEVNSMSCNILSPQHGCAKYHRQKSPQHANCISVRHKSQVHTKWRTTFDLEPAYQPLLCLRIWCKRSESVYLRRANNPWIQIRFPRGIGNRFESEAFVAL